MNKIKEAKSRWSRKMPKFFKTVMWLCGLVSGTALAVNTAMITAGAQPHEWWTDIFPYLVGIPAGAMFACKFTVNGGFEDPQDPQDPQLKLRARDEEQDPQLKVRELNEERNEAQEGGDDGDTD